MSSGFAEYDSVRIVRLDGQGRVWTAGADEIARPPRVGDRGIVLEVEESAAGRHYTIEITDGDGNTICVTDAREGELVPD